MQRTRTPQQPVRAGVGIAALAIVATAVALTALSLGDGDDAPTSPSIEASMQAREAVRAQAVRAHAIQRTASRDARDAEPLRLPSWAVPAAPKPRTEKAAPARNFSVGAVEPQWNGKGTPSREWLRWQLETLVEHGNPFGTVSGGALDAAMQDALAAREAKLAMAQARDPETLVAAQERFDAAARSLATNLGVEYVDLTAF